MKKRILSFFPVLPLIAVLCAVCVFAASVKPDPNCNIMHRDRVNETKSDYFYSAYVMNNGATATSKGTAQQLNVVVKLKEFGSQQSINAVVMKYTDYTATLPNGPGGIINGTNYYSRTVSDTSRYAIGRGVPESAGDSQTVSLRLVAPSSNNDVALGQGGTVGYKSMPKAAVEGKNYYDEYVLIVFRSGTTTVNSDYYIDRFYVDSEGYVYTPSYGVRYRENNPTGTYGTGSVSNLPVNSGANNNNNDKHTFIQRSPWNPDELGAGRPGDMTLSATEPKRVGYKFVGWTTQPRDPLGENDPVPTDADFYPAKGTFKEPAELDTIYDLYALWQVVPVRFSHTSANTDKYTVSQEGAAWILDWLDPLPQVGVSFSTGGIRYEQPNAAGAEPNGAKTFSVVRYVDGNPTSENYGLNVGRLGPNGDNSQWGVASGATGPTTHSDDKVVTFVVTVTDPSNNTSDTITVRFGKIKKGAQPVPTLDDNTGLQSRVEKQETTDEGGGTVSVDDGQIYGFYSAGPTIQTDEDETGYLATNTANNGINGTYGTGTMTAYYLNLGMVYEYRPVKVAGEAVDYTDTELPNAGWREVPFPQGWYDDSELTLLTPSLERNAATLTYSTRQAANNAAIRAQTPPEGFAGWPDSYGYIAFDESSKLPVVHGLTADDVYEVRFRSNATYEVSNAKTLTIGGAAGTGGAVTQSGGLAVNLAGGRVTNDPDTDMDETNVYSKFVTACKALQNGQSIDIPDITPTRENYSFAGWTLGEFDENGLLILYKYPEKTDEEEEGGSEGGTEGEGSEGEGSGDDGGEETPEEPTVTYRSSVTLTDSPMALAAVWEAAPYAITFYDWDGRVIDAIGAPRNAVSAVDTWQTQAWIQQRLTKPGYDFDNWIVVYENNDGEGLHSNGGSLTSRKANGEDAKLNAADIADFTDLEQMAKENSKSVLVQAVYVANETVNDSLGEDENLNLATTQYELGDTPTYYQYGPATSEVATYGITFTIKRNSMLRTDTPTIQARIYSNPTGTKSDIVTVRLDLENTDETTFEVFVPKSATQVDVVLRDTYGKTDWTNAQPRSARVTIEKAVFVYEGAMATIIDEAWQVANGTGSWNAVDRQCFLDAKCGTVPDDQIDAVRGRLVAATTANGGNKLTAAQVQSAVKGS